MDRSDVEQERNCVKQGIQRSSENLRHRFSDDLFYGNALTE
ncbi:hypothetical protein MCC93_20310 [Morococcus cerebrosus]|uniref:Uncharacterized protein n=1 Tax=Morococcus cerebrosus TaxID=1056807 RepID=A0A0C1ECE0_9NEIS|nr:hypothetical protein MCC93_20310 [Morococcus cerebrosus]